MFGDITTGRIWYAELADVLAADDGNPATVAQIHEIDAGLRRHRRSTPTARAAARARRLPGTAAVSGRGRVDLRFAIDNDGELYILTKSDGMIRKVVGARATSLTAATPPSPAPRAGAERQDARNAQRWRNPRRGDAGVDRRREEGLRHQLRRLSRQHGARAR